MRLTVLGGRGAVPTPERGCSGYLVEHDDFGLLIDPGHATFLRLLEHRPAEAVDAVLVTHSHADHCADLNPLLRARHLSDTPTTPLPLYALPGALDAVLALDGPMLTDDWTRHDVEAVCTLIAGVYGMNFDYMPELGWVLGYPLAMALMVVSSPLLYPGLQAQRMGCRAIAWSLGRMLRGLRRRRLHRGRLAAP